MLKTRTRVVLLNLALTATGLLAWLPPWPAPHEVALLDFVRATNPFMHILFVGAHIAVARFEGLVPVAIRFVTRPH